MGNGGANFYLPARDLKFLHHVNTSNAGVMIMKCREQSIDKLAINIEEAQTPEKQTAIIKYVGLWDSLIYCRCVNEGH